MIISRCRLIFVLAAVAFAQRAMTVQELLTFVKSQVKMKGDDRMTADFLLHKVKLTEKLNDKSVEELQGLGAGPKTVAALRKLEEESAGLAAAAPPPPTVVVAQKPPPDSMEQAEALAAMKEYAMNYTAKLPNYLCVQITRRHYDPKDRRYRTQGDVIQETLSFYEKKETYTVQMYNGQSVHNMSHDRLGGVRSSGEFGSMLHNIFLPESDAKFDWDHWGTLRGRPMYVFAYRVEKDHGYSMRDEESHKSYTSAYTGLVYADKETKEIQRITLKTVEIPPDFTVKDVLLTLDYKPTEISGHVYTLPFHYQLDSDDIHGKSNNEADFKMYQVYSADTTITFVDDGAPPPDQLKEQPAQGAKPPVKKQP
jgi:hypothetical protein